MEREEQAAEEEELKRASEWGEWRGGAPGTVGPLRFPWMVEMASHPDRQ
jgi:hypothetical protein